MWYSLWNTVLNSETSASGLMSFGYSVFGFVLSVVSCLFLRNQTSQVSFRVWICWFVSHTTYLLTVVWLTQTSLSLIVIVRANGFVTRRWWIIPWCRLWFDAVWFLNMTERSLQEQMKTWIWAAVIDVFMMMTEWKRWLVVIDLHY